MKKSVLFLLFLLVPSLSDATTVQRMNLDDLVRKAHQIVVGKVSSSRSYWTNDRKIILTTYSIEVRESLKGQSSRSIEVTTIGGTVGEITLHVSGMPAFDTGETAVVFLEKTGTFSTVVGLGQGKFKVVNGEVANTVRNLSFPDGQPGSRVKMPLETFKKEIQLMIDRP